MYIRKAILTVVLVLLAASPISTQMLQGPRESSTDAQPNKTLRYVNPLVMENAGRLADPTVIKFQGKYYLYLTGGVSPGGSSGAAVWSSDDLVHWEYHKVSIVGGRGIGAPTAFDYKGYVYLTGNDIGLFRSRDPLGPFEFFGDFCR